MEWLRENLFWLVVGALFFWMHLKMHGSHGHGGHGRSDSSPRDPGTSSDSSHSSSSDTHTVHPGPVTQDREPEAGKRGGHHA